VVRGLGGTFLTLGVLVASVGAAVGLDRLFRLPGWMRAATLGLIAAATLFLLTRRVLGPI